MTCLSVLGRGQTTSGACLLFWELQLSKDIDKYDGIWRRGTRMPQGLHTMPCEQWLRELGILNLEERSSKCILTNIFKYLEVCCGRQRGNTERSVRNAALDSKVEFGLACSLPTRRGGSQP